MGAWIEITLIIEPYTTFLSLLSWERGLKFSHHRQTQHHLLSLLSWERGLKYPVTLFCDYRAGVAPLVGAWIEIPKHHIYYPLTQSLLSWERGLKFCRSFVRLVEILSLLSWERGLKLKNLNTNDCVIWSLLSWERGLKFCKVSGCACTCRRSSRGSVN